MASGTGAGNGPPDQGRLLRACADALREDDPTTTLIVSETVFQIGSELVAALPMVADALQQTAGANRAKIACELGCLGAQFLAVIPRLREALRNLVLIDGDETVRTVALEALTQLGPMTTSHVPGLVETLKDAVPAARAAAAQDLAQLGPDARDSIPALISACVNDADLAVRVQAGVALWRVSRQLYPTLPTLIEGLQKGDERTCWAAADCLGDMGSDANEAVPGLQRAFTRMRQRLIRTSIALALERIDPAEAARISFG